MMRVVSIVVKGLTALIAVLVLTGLPSWAQQVIPGVNFIRLVDGLVTLPSRSYIQDPRLGSYRIGANNEGFAANGVAIFDYNGTRVRFQKPLYALTTPTDCTAPQFSWNGDTDNGLSYGGGDTIRLCAGGNQVVVATNLVTSFYSNGTLRWNVDSSGHLMANADNTYDIGASGATRPRSLYVATSINGGTLFALHSVEAITTSKSPSATETNEVYTNTGDADGTTFTLLNDPTVGSVYHFVATVAQTMTISPSAGESIRDNGSTCTDVRIGAAIGESITLIAATGGSGAIWIPMASHGGFTCTP